MMRSGTSRKGSHSVRITSVTQRNIRLRWLLILASLLLPGCSSVSTLRSFLHGDVICTGAELQQRLERRFPRDFELRDRTVTATLSNPRATLPAQHDQLRLAFDLRVAMPGFPLQQQGQLVRVSGLRFEPDTQSLYPLDPALIRFDMPLASRFTDQTLKALGNELLAALARDEPLHQLSERQQERISTAAASTTFISRTGYILIRVSL